MRPTKTQPRIILLSIFLYRWIVRLSPQEFQREYGEVILQDFRHCCHNAYTHKGPSGVLQLWPRAFVHAIIDISAEHATNTKKLHINTNTSVSIGILTITNKSTGISTNTSVSVSIGILTLVFISVSVSIFILVNINILTLVFVLVFAFVSVTIAIMKERKKALMRLSILANEINAKVTTPEPVRDIPTKSLHQTHPEG